MFITLLPLVICCVLCVCIVDWDVRRAFRHSSDRMMATVTAEEHAHVLLVCQVRGSIERCTVRYCLQISRKQALNVTLIKTKLNVCLAGSSCSFRIPDNSDIKQMSFPAPVILLLRNDHKAPPKQHCRIKSPGPYRCEILANTSMSSNHHICCLSP